MSYQVLARKYRPQTFDDLIGQSHVSTTLINALKSGKVAHAYLFSGPRGVGKTTIARILAKALNCEKGPTPTPCNKCDSCERISQGQEMVDVLEIDAASNRGIEEIRELRDNVRYAPARSRYKVYIVDEAHQITHDAFNAFLKTLEEPPAHAVFILATTEHQKIPATILSRCQMFRFKRVVLEEIVERLEKIAKAEKLSVEKAALERLAKASGGSVRDSLSLLDQALAYTTSTLTAKQVETLLGFLPDEFLVGFASALLERKPSGVLQWTRQLADEGWELPQFVRDFREFLRQTIVEQVSAGAPEPQSVGDVPGVLVPRGSGAIQIAGRSVTLAEILFMMKVMGQCLDEMRWNDNPQLVLELYALRLTQPFVDAGELLKKLSGAVGGVGVVGDLRAVTPPKPLTTQTSPTTQTPPTVARASAPTAPAAHESSQPLPGDAASLWKQLLAELWKKPSVASHMERAYLKSVGGEWVIAFVDRFSMDAVVRSQSFVQETIQKIAGRPFPVRFVHEARETRETAPMEIVAAPVAEQEMSAAVSDPSVKKVLDVFKGRVRSSEE